MKKLSLVTLLAALMALPFFLQPESATADSICRCIRQRTPDVTRVGSTCSNARINAANAARAEAVCPANSEGPCGPVKHYIGTCSPNPYGDGFQATAYATYYCEYCF